MVANTGGTLADASMPNIPYDTFLGVTLASGLGYVREQNREILYSSTSHNMFDIMQIPETTIAGCGSDGTNTWVTIRVVHTEPFILKPENDDKIYFTISDDLSGLLEFSISAGCRIESRSL